MSISVHIRKKLKDFMLAVDFESEDGCVGILGASGCGKSMTLKCIAGIEKPDEGKIVLNGRVLFDSEKKINLSPQKRKVGYLFQQYALFPHMTVRKNIQAGLSGSDKTFRDEEAKEEYIRALSEQFHIAELMDVFPPRLSGGQQQRTALARMIASAPEILLLDEPFSALDSYLREQLLQEMKGFLASYQKDVLMVSHNRDEVYQMCPHMAIMGTGNIEISGDTKRLFQRPVTTGAARLTGCKNISRIKKTDRHHLYAIDWGKSLFVEEEITDDITHVGIRAHEFMTAAGDDFNLMKCSLEGITEAPFEVYLMLKNEDYRENKTSQEDGEGKQLLWWKVSKKEWMEMKETVPDRIYFPPEHIILLKENKRQ